MANPLDHPVDDNLKIDVPGKLRAAAKARRAKGEYRMAKDMEDEATRVELKRKLAKGTPGQKAVINRMHERENMNDWKSAGLVVGLLSGGFVFAGLLSSLFGNRSSKVTLYDSRGRKL